MEACLNLKGEFANDLRYVAADMGVAVGDIRFAISVGLEGSPVGVVGAEMLVSASMSDRSDPSPLIAKAKEISMAMNSVIKGLTASMSERKPRLRVTALTLRPGRLGVDPQISVLATLVVTVAACALILSGWLTRRRV